MVWRILRAVSRVGPLSDVEAGRMADWLSVNRWIEQH
jgi:hypothetical protein